MYFHIGQNMMIAKSDVVGVFDLDNTSSSHLTRSFLARMEKAGNVVNASEDIPKSFVLCEEHGKITVYLSQLSYQTLLRRSRQAAPESILFQAAEL